MAEWAVTSRTRGPREGIEDIAGDGTAAEAAPSGARVHVFRRLLDGDRSVRVRALAQAADRRWLERSEGLVVALVETTGSEEERRRLATALQSDGRGALWHIGDLATRPVLVVSRSRLAGDVEDALASAARRHGHPDVRLATTTVEPDEDDLLPAVREALILLDAPEHATPAGIRVLLDEVHVPLDLIRRASPGAFALWRAGDRQQLDTVEAYLDAGARVSEACRRLHLHRTTLYYRLENLPAPVRDELSDGLRRSVLHVALKMLRRHPADDARITGG